METTLRSRRDEPVTLDDPVEETPLAARDVSVKTEQVSASDVATHITPAMHARFVRGMTIAEAQAFFSFAPKVVGGDGKETVIYRWEDAEGANFTVRFEAGVLTLVGGLRQPRRVAEVALSVGPGVLANDGPVAEVAPGVFVPLERAVAASVGQPLGVAAPPLMHFERGETNTSEVAKKVELTIVVAGARRRDRKRETATEKNSEHSYTARAKLPEFGHSLHAGRYEIRLLNPTNTVVTVGLRKYKRGHDLTIPPKGQASVKVERGIYELYFLRDDDPDALYEANPIAIDGVRVTNVEVHLNPEDVELRIIDYGVPE